MSRPIDHLVLAVPDLAAAVERYRAMGFTVGGENRHPWGTVNAVVQLAGTYLELISLGADFSPPPPGDAAGLFAVPVARAVARGGELAMLAFASDDADGDAARFTAAGIGSGGRLDFGRAASRPDGSPRILRFGLAFVDAPSLGPAKLFTCRHHQPFGDGLAPRHANGALALDGVVLEVDMVERCASVLEVVVGGPPCGPAGCPSFATATGRVDVMPLTREGPRGRRRRDFAGRFSSFAIAVEDLDRVRTDLERRGIGFDDAGGRVTVPAPSRFGAALDFIPAACDAVA